MLSPADWRDDPPHPFLGTYRQEADCSWTAQREDQVVDETGDLVDQPLCIRGTEGADA